MIMSRRSVFALLVSLGIIVMGRGHIAAAGESRVVASPPSWDYGYLPQKSEVHYVYYLKNISSAPVTVTKIKAGCSCTSVSKLDKPIPPGDSAAVVVTFKTGRYHHLVKKATSIYTDDPKTPACKLRLRANVYKIGEETGRVRVTPPKLTWKVKDAKITPGEDTLTIANLGPQAVQAAILQSPDDWVDWVLPRDSIGPGREVELILRPTKQAITDKITGLSITIGLTCRDTAIVTVPLKIEM